MREILCSGVLNALSKLRFAPARPVESWIAAVGQILQTAFQKMAGRQPGDGGIIGLDPRNIGQETPGTDINHRQADSPHNVRNLFSLNSGNDPVTSPAAQPVRRTGTAFLFRQEDRPVVLSTHEGNHAIQ